MAGPPAPLINYAYMPICQSWYRATVTQNSLFLP